MLTFLLSEDPTVPRPDDALVTPRNASNILDCSQRYVYSLVERGELAMVKDGRFNKIPLSSVNDYMTRLKRRAQEKIAAGIDAEPPPPPRRGRPRKRPVRAIGEEMEK